MAKFNRIQIQTLIGAATVSALVLSGCGSARWQHLQPTDNGPNQPGQSQSMGAGRAPHAPDATYATDQQSEVLQAQQNRNRYVEVTITAPVLKMLPEDTRGLPHEQFLLGLSNGTTVKVAHDTKLAPRVPLRDGDTVRIHGEYIWNQRGGVIHWTHHSPNGRHEGGWIDFNGTRYQ